jgi:hypothetical protein
MEIYYIFAQKAASSPIPNPRHFINCYSKGPQMSQDKCIFIQTPLTEWQIKRIWKLQEK